MFRFSFIEEKSQIFGGRYEKAHVLVGCYLFVFVSIQMWEVIFNWLLPLVHIFSRVFKNKSFEKNFVLLVADKTVLISIHMGKVWAIIEWVFTLMLLFFYIVLILVSGSFFRGRPFSLILLVVGID